MKFAFHIPSSLYCLMIFIEMMFFPAHEHREAQRVADDEQRRTAHRCRRDHRIERHTEYGETACRKRNAHAVIEECPEKILLDDAHGAPCERKGAGRRGEIAAHQDDICAFDGDVRAAAHCNTDVRFFERGGVVDAVADHGDALFLPPAACGVFLLYPDHIVKFLLREHFGAYHVRGNPRFFGNGARTGGIVAREHVRLKPVSVQFADRRTAARLERIGKPEHGHHLFAVRKEEHGHALLGECL